MDAPSHKFCVSWYTLQVAQVGTTLCNPGMSTPFRVSNILL